MFKTVKSKFKAVKCAFTNHIPYTAKQQALLKTLMFAAMLVAADSAFSQDGNAGIQSATTMIQGYFDTGCTLMYAIGAVVGIVGAIKVFNKWNAGEPDTNKVAAAWFGSCIFLVVVATVIKSFFGVS
ncbi:uncharacterized protein DUF4134 [Mucilaginibacter frigoritolerans]|uniref:Uncharacterized protein DUF4134 n=2 Tax=Mucilaginibacter frigoritolerans TaxID=652788 RepID=A0A562TVG4_9SPHI|nr:uncharacterized protein DUF4134 [Mucilaginibacter frigoritolerans]